MSFDNREAFASAMMDGRDANGNTWRWHNGAFWCGSISTSTFNVYGIVTEILPEPEPWEPQEGDEILVWNESETHTRKFICMANNYYVCTAAISKQPFTWKHAKPLPAENPWRTIIKNEWPDCKPADKIEVKDADNRVVRYTAGAIDWHVRVWNKWRLAE